MRRPTGVHGSTLAVVAVALATAATAASSGAHDLR
jgi:hypothetical protein